MSFMTRWLRFLVPAAIAASVVSSAALADIYVHLKDGKTIIVPVDRDDVQSIEILPKGATPSSEPAAGQLPSGEPPASAPKARAAGPALPEGGQVREGSIHAPHTYRVGPDQEYKRPSDLAKIARDGDTIEIEAGTYTNDWAIWYQNNLTFKGVGGRPHIQSTREIDNEKGIWIINGDNVTLENLEFSGARVDDTNGAGIRAQGGKLTIRDCYFHDNQFGVLSDNKGRGDITIENSEFYHQIRDGTYAHNIYIGHAARFRLTGSYIHGAVGGHQVKARAEHTYIAYNRIMDGTDGTGSYGIDLPNCGEAYIIGNVIQQGRKSENYTGIAYGAEGCPEAATQAAYIVNNTFVNDAPLGTFVTNHTNTALLLRNNLIVGIARLAAGPVTDDNNLLEVRQSFADRDKFDFHLTKDSAGIDKGVPAGKVENGLSLVPELQYQDPIGTVKRPVVGKLDIGAFEYTP
jgi:hypothetical protein